MHVLSRILRKIDGARINATFSIVHYETYKQYTPYYNQYLLASM